MRKAFVTYLGSNDFLPGVLALAKSLKEHNKEELVILINKRISKRIVSFLSNNSFKIKIAEEIKNPNSLGTDIRGFRYVYTKLNVFGMVEFDKIIYIDADMLVCDCIDSLFSKPHMSAVNAGALLIENKSWDKLNSGLLVIEPSAGLFKDIKSLTSKLPSETKGDQGFLHSYFNEWPNQKELHLEHKYNIPAIYIDRYCAESNMQFSYKNNILSTTNVSLLHFWGPIKPWHSNAAMLKGLGGVKYRQSLELWLNYFGKINFSHIHKS